MIVQIPRERHPRKVSIAHRLVGQVIFNKRRPPFDKRGFYYRIYPHRLEIVPRTKEFGFMGNELQNAYDEAQKALEEGKQNLASDDRGLFMKYRITKTDGTPVDPRAKYFILRLDTDEYARLALAYYAGLIHLTRRELAADLLLLIASLEHR